MVDTIGDKSTFGQLMNELGRQQPSMYRVRQDMRAFTVSYVGMMSHDAGGPYRDAIDAICKELQSTLVPLFIQCPNGRSGMGWNRETFVPNQLPEERNGVAFKTRIRMYEWLGQFMGLAVRSKTYLNINLPSIVWKDLVHDQITMNDVKSIDHLGFNIIDQLSAAAREEDMSHETFDENMKNVKFTVMCSDGVVRPLIKNGAHVSISWSNKHIFSEALIRYRLGEFREQTEAIMRGLATVIPYRLLGLFTWKDLQYQVCGLPTFDVELLRKKTVYAGFTRGNKKIGEGTPHIKHFWTMMNDMFSEEQRSQFLRFVWGRSRLPIDEKSFEKDLTLMANPVSQNSNVDQYFPQSHTCFFQLELPEYSTAEVMYEKFSIAISMCTSIDGDETQVARNTAAMMG
jgi:E3 ubiquitin-protein ligase HERC2